MGRCELNQQLRQLAFSDSLTGLANRACFRTGVEHALSRRQAAGDLVAVLFLHLDDFKVINDSLGHKAGDHLLVTVAQRLEARLRPVDTAARLGGDEFAVLLEETGGERGAVEVAERILDLLRLPILLDAVDKAHGERVLDRELFAHASIGIAVSSPATAPEDPLRNADLAMYAAKTQGKGGTRPTGRACTPPRWSGCSSRPTCNRRSTAAATTLLEAEQLRERAPENPRR